MIKLVSIDLPKFNSQNLTNLHISRSSRLERMPIKDYLPQYSPEKVFENNSLLQLFASFWVGNGFLDSSYSLTILMNKAPILSLLLCNEYIYALPSIFNKIFILYTASNKAIGFNVHGIKDNACKALLKLRAENRIDPYLNDMFMFCEQQNINNTYNNFFRVIREDDLQLPKSLLNNALTQYLLQQCLIIGECMIPLMGFTEDEITSKIWIKELTIVFERVIIHTTNDSKWITQGLIVSNIRKEIIALASENTGQSFSSLGLIGE